MKIKIGDKDFNLKDKVTGNDYLDQRSLEEREAFILMLNLYLTNKKQVSEVLELDYKDFIEFTAKLQEKIGSEFDFLEDK